MIKNDKQLTVTMNQREKLNQAITKLEGSAHSDPMTAVRVSALQADMEKLDAQIEKYQKATEGLFDAACLICVESVGEELISARIAAGLTQEELARKARMKAQQIQRYERLLYETASLRTLTRISAIISASVRGDFRGDGVHG